MALVGTLAWHTSTGALAIRWTPPPSLCRWNASKGICRSSAGNHHSRTLRSFNPSVFPGGGAMTASSLPTPSDAPVIVWTPAPHFLSSTPTRIWYHTAITVEDNVNKSENVICDNLSIWPFQGRGWRLKKEARDCLKLALTFITKFVCNYTTVIEPNHSWFQWLY